MNKLVFLFIAVLSLTFCEEKSTETASTFEEDQAVLSLQLDEITRMAESFICTNPNQWLYAPIGSKPCGGPWDYIAYHEDSDTTLFLEKVSEYTEAENSFNEKWGLGSDCAFVSPPDYIICENGKAVLVY